MLKTILLATDGSELSKKASQAAIDFARGYGSTIIGLSVVETVPVFVMPEMGTGMDWAAIEEQIQAQSDATLKALTAMAQKAGVPCEVYTVKGQHPYEEILKYAELHHCDTIFMASHGRKGLDKFILGSETQKVLTHSKVPVLVFK
ncbi:universal stress protein [Herbaspirillum sp. RTI4]|uniref:universal stress protein n=1 Tax=Herbaspirillum sp. RTI4 TaxID=3048640 RepID=UPI002AB57100|nr:universal stress protein [Herbaspirillum sp. RTI4]MDY7578946.1 universal stress protein [Herbaspirillum sp. RTI4]MEA9980877.1 universal stress protein [Herbaspirillum sp. RTI4]